MTDVTFNGISVRATVDEYPHLDYLGEYRSEPGPDDRTIDRQARGDQGRHEARYFVAPYSDEEAGAEGAVEQNYQRAEAYGTEWLSLGLHAVADLTITLDNGQQVHQSIKSGGIWGVESDGDAEYLAEHARAEVHEVLAILDALGVDYPDDLTADYIGDANLKGTVEV